MECALRAVGCFILNKKMNQLVAVEENGKRKILWEGPGQFVAVRILQELSRIHRYLGR
jgi:hypothetical protein